MASGYIVTAGCVVAKYADGAGEGYFYEGALLPDIVPDEEKQRLVDVGLVEEVELVVVEPVVVEKPVDTTEGLDLDALKAYAAEQKIDLGKASTVDGIRTKIIEARAAQV